MPTVSSTNTDCSGFVSMAWKLGRSYSTRTLGAVSRPITKAALKPGDALLSYDNHVVLFVLWADTAHIRYVGREQTSSITPTGTIERTIPYPYFTRQSSYHPVRADNVVD